MTLYRISLNGKPQRPNDGVVLEYTHEAAKIAVMDLIFALTKGAHTTGISMLQGGDDGEVSFGIVSHHGVYNVIHLEKSE